MRRLMDWLQHLVPASWRTTVSTDLAEEARELRRGNGWIAWQTLRTGTRLRWSLAGDVAVADLRYAIRSLLHARGFTLAAVLTLVLGMAVNLAVFSVVDRALFRPLPFRATDRIVFVSPYSPEQGTKAGSFNKRLFIETRQRVDAIEDMAYAGFTYQFRLADEPASAALAFTEVSYNILDVLGAIPALGRGFQRTDAEARTAVAMISFETWQSRFGGNPSVFGAAVRLRDETMSIVGVLPPGFIVPAMNRSPRFDGLYVVPDLMESAGPRDAVDPGVARLSPGATIEIAQLQFDAVAAGLDAELARPGAAHGPRVLVEDLRAGMFWSVYRYLWLVTLAASLVGLLACANLSALLLARGRSRARDVALRASLGASAARLTIAELMQSLVVCVMSAAVSLTVMVWMVELLGALVPTFYRQFVLATVDWRLAGFAAASAIAAAVVAGAVPAWRATRADLQAIIQRPVGAPASRRPRRAGGMVLAFEAAVGIVLVAGAAAAGRSFVGLALTDAGFQPVGLHVLTIEPPGVRRGGDDAAELARYRGILEVLRRQPGVLSAGASDSTPAGGAAPMHGATWNGAESMGLWSITDGFLATLGARLLAGRDVTNDDVEHGRPVALVSQAAARRLWPGIADRDVVGREISATDQPTRAIVGVVADLRERPDAPATPMVFAPVSAAQDLWYMEFIVRSRDGGVPNPERLRQQMSTLGVTSIRMQPAGSRIRSALDQPRSQAIIFGSFAVVGLLLAAVGLFAVASFDVALRRSEMGIRVALGASAREIRALVVRDVLRPVLSGSIAGLLVAWWAARFMQAMVHQVDARDPWTLALVVAVLAVTAIAAAWLPANRAARTDPVEALRAQ